jgi:hypothetical protein
VAIAWTVDAHRIPHRRGRAGLGVLGTVDVHRIPHRRLVRFGDLADVVEPPAKINSTATKVQSQIPIQ